MSEIVRNVSNDYDFETNMKRTLLNDESSTQLASDQLEQKNARAIICTTYMRKTLVELHFKNYYKNNV